MKLHLRSWAGLGGSGVLALALFSCDATDPALEEKVSKLEAENASLKQRLTVAEQSGSSSGEEAQQQIQAAQAEAQQAQQALQALQARFDRKRLERSFADAFSEFQQKLGKKFPEESISKYSAEKMVMPSDHPFSTVLTISLKNNTSGQVRETYWKALGNLDGEWNFNKSEPDQIAANQPAAGAPPLTRPVVTPPPQPAQPAQPTNPGGGIATGVRRLPSSGGTSSGSGRVHVIDWGD